MGTDFVTPESVNNIANVGRNQMKLEKKKYELLKNMMPELGLHDSLGVKKTSANSK